MLWSYLSVPINRLIQSRCNQFLMKPLNPFYRWWDGPSNPSNVTFGSGWVLRGGGLQSCVTLATNDDFRFWVNFILISKSERKRRPSYRTSKWTPSHLTRRLEIKSNSNAVQGSIYCSINRALFSGCSQHIIPINLKKPKSWSSSSKGEDHPSRKRTEQDEKHNFDDKFIRSRNDFSLTNF